ncbi:MAG: ferrous iron transport protein B [Clostridia bacterium]|nr:ferrous iron transport protein B [Clostridia bacterium]
MTQKNYKIALIGNPNSGKTTLFNALTKMRQTVGNWPGVTIEKKQGVYYKNKSVTIVDLPGIYSLTPYSLEEKIARDYLQSEKPDLIINIIDTTNLERNLYLTTQLAETGAKVVAALNMLDELESSGISVDENRLSDILGIRAMPISALKNRNITKLMDLCLAEINRPSKALKIEYPEDIEKALSEISQKLELDRFSAIKVFERDSLTLSRQDKDFASVEKTVLAAEKRYGEKGVEIISNLRYAYIEKIIPSFQTKKMNKRAALSAKIDKVLTNKYLAFPIFVLIIWLMYFISIQTLGNLGLEALERVLELLKGSVRGGLEAAGISPWLIGLVVDGIITGVGTILTFLPQIILLFLFISLLEGCGYMARVAYIMDRLFKKIGLSGKSFIPMIIGCGCSVPAIMSARTVENNDERRLTIMLTPFIPCSAKLPVFALFVGAFFPDNAFVAPSMYLLGIAMVIAGGLLLKKLRLFKTQSDTFVLELPQYRLPQLKNVLIELWEKSKSFIIKAGTIIFAASIVLWVLQNFDWSFRMVEAERSLLASIGNVLAPIFAPLGFGDWRASVALLAGMFAKETVVSSLSILLGSEADIAAALATIFTPLSAYSFMAFVLLSFPCIAALGATKKEMGSTKWLLITMGFQVATAYLVAFLIYNIGSLYFYNKWIVLAPLIFAAASVAAIYLYKRIKKKGAKT